MNIIILLTDMSVILAYSEFLYLGDSTYTTNHCQCYCHSLWVDFQGSSHHRFCTEQCTDTGLCMASSL